MANLSRICGFLENVRSQKSPHFRVFDPKMTQMRHQSKKIKFYGCHKCGITFIYTQI